MQSPVRRLWFVLCSSLALWVTGCVADNTDCGGPTSDWPFCRGGGPSPAFSGGGAERDEGESTGGASEDAGAGPPTFSGDGGSTGGGHTPGDGGAVPTTDVDPDDVCLLCQDPGDPLSGLGGSEFDVEDGGCGRPLPCPLEVELDGGDQKSLEGTAPLDFTHGSVTWESNAPGYVDVFLRAVDGEGDEVRVAMRFEESALQGASGARVAASLVQGVDCGGDPAPVLQASVSLLGLGWNAGFHGLITLEGEGWRAEIDLAALGVCWPD